MVKNYVTHINTIDLFIPVLLQDRAVQVVRPVHEVLAVVAAVVATHQVVPQLVLALVEPERKVCGMAVI